MMTIDTRTALNRRNSALLLVTAFLLCSTAAFSEAPACRTKGEIKVVYPELARRMKIIGTVRLELQLTTSGNVRETKVLGGNPVLATSAQQAVKQAKFEGAEPCIAIFNFKE
jgi:TonB family protein